MTSTNFIAELIAGAIGGDILAQQGGGFVSVMAKNRPGIRQDIPAAFEMYTLLSHFLSALPIVEMSLGGGPPRQALSASIMYDQAGGRLVALIPIGANEMADIAYWLADGLPSGRVRQMAGLLALPFSIEEHGGHAHLLPEWFAAFYVDGDAGHCVPMLALRSIMHDQHFSGDWVDIALNRMSAFSLPHHAAQVAVHAMT